MKKITTLLTLFCLTLLLLAPAGWAEPSATVKAVYDALTAEDSDYSQFKAMYAEFAPGIEYVETLTDDGFTLAITGSEYMDGSWTFVGDGDDLVTTMNSDDINGAIMLSFVQNATAEALGMDRRLVTGYVSGMSAHNLTSGDFSMTSDDTTSTTRLRIAGPWAMDELDQLVLDETLVAYGPLDANHTSMAANCGKLMMVANGTVNDATILIGEYGGLDELARQSIVNVVNILKPAGYEDFIAAYTELADAETADYTVRLNVDAAAVGEIIEEALPEYSYALLHFGAASDAAEDGAPAPEEAPSVEALKESYFDAVANIPTGKAGASLSLAIAASEVCDFAEQYSLYNPDVEALRANMLTAFEAMDDEGQAAFWENFEALRALLDDCLEDYDARRDLFDDAGVAEAMDAVMYDPLNRLAWENLRDHTLTMGNDAEPEMAAFTQWNPDAPSLNALVDYVTAVTDPASPDFIPEADRIATFDMDGTLCAELNPTYLEYYLLARRILTDESYQPDAEMLEFGRMLRDHALDRSFPDGMDMLHATHAAKAYAGMTLNEFADFVTREIVREADGFEGMTYAESFYLPMIEVVEYLQANGFSCYVCSGSDRFICRTFVEGMLDIPYQNIIGMDVQLKATNQGDEDGLHYVFGENDTLERTDVLLIKNLKTNKVLQIAQDIGKQPVLSFGNSGGDVAMHNYALYNNRYRSAAFQLIADDGERDYGNPDKGPELREKWESMGFTVISMADDWKTIYGEDVKKTGEFHWLDDLAEDRTPVDAAA